VWLEGSVVLTDNEIRKKNKTYDKATGTRNASLRNTTAEHSNQLLEKFDWRTGL
jgi:recombinational DNA repair ATPase RecF